MDAQPTALPTAWLRPARRALLATLLGVPVGAAAQGETGDSLDGELIIEVTEELWLEPSEAPPPVTPDAATPDAATPDAATPGAAAADGIQAFPDGVAGRVRPAHVELRASAGPAYVSRGRAYQGDRVLIRARTANAEWLEIEAGGIRGWVSAREIELLREKVRLGADGQVDPGRDRRERNYRYDARGRRFFLDGRAQGSGEGAEGDTPSEEEIEALATGARLGEDPWLTLRLSVGVARLGRRFESSIEQDERGLSGLRRLNSVPAGMSTEVVGDWRPLPYLGARVALRDVRFGSTPILAYEEAGFPRDFELSVSGQQIDVEAVGRYGFGSWSVGGFAGLHVLRTAYQQTRPYPLFLTYAFIGPAGGLTSEVRIGAADVALRVGAFVPLSVSQSPASSGDASGFGYLASLDVGYALTAEWALVLGGHFERVSTDFRGGSTHVDNVTDPDGGPPRAYDAARSVDRALGGTLGVRWTVP